jgi:hypothetical protein
MSRRKETNEGSDRNPRSADAGLSRHHQRIDRYPIQLVHGKIIFQHGLATRRLVGPLVPWLGMSAIRSEAGLTKAEPLVRPVAESVA